MQTGIAIIPWYSSTKALSRAGGWSTRRSRVSSASIGSLDRRLLAQCSAPPIYEGGDAFGDAAAAISTVGDEVEGIDQANDLAPLPSLCAIFFVRQVP